MFNINSLDKIDFSKYKRIGVAFSGGVDSLVLLHSLSLIVENREKLFALHVNHGISSKSSSWEKHCKETCTSLHVQFVSFDLDYLKKEGLNENDLRNARYKKLLSWATKDDVLCTAHHKDDQSETILFRILRGTGIKGLKGIEQFSYMEGIPLLRPLLNFSKEDLIEYAKFNSLTWVEDESNKNSSIPRNFLRQQTLPTLTKHWPNYSDSFKHLANKAKEADKILAEIAVSDFNSCVGNSIDQLSISSINRLSKERKKNLISRWLNTFQKTSVSSSLVEQILRNIILSRRDSNPVISFGKPGGKNSFQLRKFKDHIFFLPYLETNSLKENDFWNWDLESPLVLPTGTLSCKKVFGEGLSLEFAQDSLVIKTRSGGERCKPLGRSKSQKLKKLFQEYSVAPWLRDRLPLIYINTNLVAVSDLWICDKFNAEKGEEGFLLNWMDNMVARKI